MPKILVELKVYRKAVRSAMNDNLGLTPYTRRTNHYGQEPRKTQVKNYEYIVKISDEKVISGCCFEPLKRLVFREDNSWCQEHIQNQTFSPSHRLYVVASRKIKASSILKAWGKGEH